MNDLKPIRTEDDYEAALTEIEALFSAKPNTPEGDRLESPGNTGRAVRECAVLFAVA